jgi:hypothetical protein
MTIDTAKGKLPVRYGMNALAHFGDLTGRNMNEVMSSLQDLGKLKMSEMLTFIYVGFVDGARWAKEECKVEDVAEVGDMIDDDAQLMTKVTAVFLGEEEKTEGGSKKK